MKQYAFLALSAAVSILLSCNDNNATATNEPSKDSSMSYIQQRVALYEKVKLTTNLSQLTAKEKEMLPLLMEAAGIMDDLFWLQAYGNKDSLLNAAQDEAAKQFMLINYGPWDRLNNDTPFIAGAGIKPPGANFYPKNMTKEEFEKADLKDKEGLYTVVKRDAAGKLYSVPYHEEYKAQLEKAASLLKAAAELAEDAGLKKYLQLRAEALVTSKYTASDMAWMDMKTNGIDFIIGPIENYEDKLFSYRASFEAYLLVKDKEWSRRLAKYVAMLPELQEGLPVEKKYRSEKPGTDSELNAYDVIYYAGDCNAGSKTIAVNLPNDETIQKTKGTRRSQLKNAMQAKFDKILMPIADELIDASQLSQIAFDAFFSNVMFHEVAHGLGIKQTVNGKGTVRAALQEQNSWLEEAKADILGLYMVTTLVEKGELEGTIESYYTTYMAGILRSVRFGAASAHGKANMLNFNFLQEKGAFEKTSEGRYKVNYEKFRSAMNDLGALILTLQGNGDKAGVEALQKEKSIIKTDLKSDLDALQQKGIPVDIVFEQGLSALGLK
ncbi:hypothetical protein [Agriterribacter sp.]|uniref:dipeptidyl-peptidase 3 family protein n=1 Tax=Agriterribacter sp. TaxID=2821509 RepID=UPI002C397B5A|nr:hypothetical protein [Agriterribacter sp.]HRO46277.1 hypothetical protein [Agriterribacter sp.]HRQ18518.1 hypothetical protein [Agriterribacter sp.]